MNEQALRAHAQIIVNMMDLTKGERSEIHFQSDLRDQIFQLLEHFLYPGAEDMVGRLREGPPLSETNPYLRDPVGRAKQVRNTVESSCAVERGRG